MTNVNISLLDFSAGEISKKIYGRHDIGGYYNSGRRVENFIPETIGPGRFRQGTIYDGPSRLNNKPLLYPFSFGDSVSYILEFTNTKIRFYNENGRIHATGQNITNITQANPAVVTYSGADTYANGDSVYISGVVGMTEVNNKEFIVANLTAGSNTFELSGINSTAYTAYDSGGTVEEIIEVTTPYGTNDLYALKFAQNGKKLFITHPSYNPQKLTYTSATSWAFAAHSPIQETYGDRQAITGITQANPAVVTYSGADNFANGDEVIITGVSGMTEVNDERFTVANVNTGANTFELSGINSTAYTAYSSGGIVREIVKTAASFLSSGEYPSAVGVYEDRIIYGGSNNSPTTIWGSRSNEEDDFTLGTEVDDGFEYVIAGGGGKINWIRGTNKFMAIGTFGDVLQATGGIDNVITPTSISIRPSNSYGVLDINPQGKGTSIFYMQANGLVLRSFEYDFTQDSYIPRDRNMIADHVLSSGATQIDFQEGRPNVVWVCKNDGTWAGMTLEEGEGVSGWHRHTTDGEVISIASLSRNNSYDQLWLAVKRTINGSDYYYIEHLSDFVEFPTWESFVDLEDSEENCLTRYNNVMYEYQKEYIHIDSALTYRGDNQSVTMTPSAVSGASVTFTAGGSVFSASDVGRKIWRKSITGNEYGRATITGYTSGTVVTCRIDESFNSVTAIPAGEWYLTSDTLTGADHLEGKTVRVVADGGQHPDVTVTGGVVSLDFQASVVHVGIPYTGYIESNDLEGGGVNGTAQTKRKGVYAVGVRMFDSLYAKVGTSYYSLDQIQMRTASMRMDRPPEMFNGDVMVNYTKDINDPRDGGKGREKRIIIVQDQPFPCNIALVVPYMNVSN